jgi:hypothetical protein
MNRQNVFFQAVMFLFLETITAAVCAAGSPVDGAALYRKHCAGCHPAAAAFKSAENIVSLLREPPAAMPAFGTGRLSEREAQAVDDFIRHGDQNAGKATEAAAAPPPATVAVAAPARNPVPANPVPDQRLREKKPRTRPFVKKWSIKGLRNGEVVSFQDFEITANARNELAVTPSVTLLDYSARVSAFEVINNVLKLQLTWKWKNSPSYWKIDTYQLTLSDDGKKLSGSYNLQAAGGQNITSSVWGE